MHTPAKTPQPPYFAVIFTSVRADGNDDDDYAETAQRLLEMASKQPGFLGFESARHGLGISVSYWSSLETIKAWEQSMDHGQAAGKARDWYEQFRVRVCLVEREYGFDLS